MKLYNLRTVESLISRGFVVETDYASKFKTGILNKRGGRYTAYKERKFILRGNVLGYFEKNSRLPNGIIFLEGCTADHCLSDGEGGFQIEFVGGNRNYQILAPSFDEAKSWVNALESAPMARLRDSTMELKSEVSESSTRPSSDVESASETDSSEPKSSTSRGICFSSLLKDLYNDIASTSLSDASSPFPEIKITAEEAFTNLHSKYSREILLLQKCVNDL